MAERLIVALDVASVREAQLLVTRLDDAVSFFKIGLGLAFAPGVDGLIDGLVGRGKRVFLDAKMFDIPETVGRAVAVAARRRVSFVTVHGDERIMRAAVEGKGASDLKVFAVTVLTSLDDAALREMGYGVGAHELVQMRARKAVACGCDGIIASANDNPDGIRRLAETQSLLIATPGVRQASGDVNDHKRTATPGEAIRNGADYLVVGRPIVAAPDPVAAARSFIAEMEAARPGS
ncbi:MAG TPA: orotidine-5'-phosphate decarboxylase [Acetobacteraceae bacterium]|nr:orotidine-5'-phosphate decarboxylase [Acetobacteraceae bacterium]